jgi:hypothetical protein
VWFLNAAICRNAECGCKWLVFWPVTFEQQRQDYVDALGWVADLMAGTTPAQLGGSTPCDQFDVRLLMGHLIGTAGRGLGTAERVSTRDIPHVVTDVRDEDLAVNYTAFVDQIRLAWSRLDADDQVIGPY